MWACAAVLLFLQTPDYTAEGLKALDGGRYGQAAELFGKAVAADPKDYGAHFNLALSYTMLKRSEEHTSELQSLRHLVCRLLLEKKKTSTTGCSSPRDFRLSEAGTGPQSRA